MHYRRLVECMVCEVFIIPYVKEPGENVCQTSSLTGSCAACAYLIPSSRLSYRVT